MEIKYKVTSINAVLSQTVAAAGQPPAESVVYVVTLQAVPAAGGVQGGGLTYRAAEAPACKVGQLLTGALPV